MSWDSSEDRAQVLDGIRGLGSESNFDDEVSRSLVLGGFGQLSIDDDSSVEFNVLYQLYGKGNITQWADLDNDGVQEDVDARIQFAIDFVRDELRTEFLQSMQSYPFSEPLSFTVNVMRKVGVFLYEARGVVDTTDPEGKHRLSYNKKQAETYFNKCLAGQISVGILTVSVPFTTDDDGASDAPIGLEL